MSHHPTTQRLQRKSWDTSTEAACLPNQAAQCPSAIAPYGPTRIPLHRCRDQDASRSPGHRDGPVPLRRHGQRHSWRTRLADVGQQERGQGSALARMALPGRVRDGSGNRRSCGCCGIPRCSNRRSGRRPAQARQRRPELTSGCRSIASCSPRVPAPAAPVRGREDGCSAPDTTSSIGIIPAGMLDTLSRCVRARGRLGFIC